MINLSQVVGSRSRRPVVFVATVFLLGLLIVATGCSSQSTVRDFSDLTGTQWEMTSMIVATAEFPGSPGDFNLEIGTKSVSGRSDCNLWSADFLSGSDNDLTIENMISTEIACPPTSIEGPYFDLLMRISTFESVNKTLILRADNFDQIMYRQIES